MKCKNCNAEIEDSAKVCRWCGAELVDTNKKLWSKKRRNILVGITTCIMIVLLVTTFATTGRWLHPSDKPNNSVAVTQGNQGGTDSDVNPSGAVKPSNPIQNLFFVVGKERTVYNTRVDQLNPQIVLSKYSDHGQSTIYESKDGKRIISWIAMKSQPDLNNPAEYEMFYTDLTSKDKQKYKIDSGVILCGINQSGTKVYYLKGKEFYVWDIKGKIKLSDGVNNFIINKMGDKVLYTTEDGQGYLMQDNQVKQKLGGNVVPMYISDDMNTIYYSRDSTLYNISNGSNPVEVASEINILKIYKTGQLYYTVQSTEAFKEGEIPDGLPNIDLYYFSDGQSKLIQKHCLDANPVFCGSDSEGEDDIQPFAVFSVKNSKLEKSKSSDQNAVFSTKDVFLCKGTEIIGKLATGNVSGFKMNSGYESIYYTYDNQEKKTIDLYYNTLKNLSLSQSKKLSENIYDFITYGKDVIIFRNLVVNTDKQMADLYFNNKKIDNEVDPTSFQIIDKSNYTYSKGEFNALILLHDGKKKTIAEHVKSYHIYNENLIAYIKSDEHGLKSLYLYKGTEQDQLIKKDVVDLIKPLKMMYGFGSGNFNYLE